jgi:hydrogenase nickel incorporation protein HypB
MHDFSVNKRLWDQTDELGLANRRRLEEARIYCINVMSAPGAGKTTLLERTLERIAPGPRFGVIEGDIQGRADADRLERFGIPVRQINTNGACHLDPRQVAAALDTMDLGSIDLLVIENVGNLVCPAEFDLGEADRVMLLSVTEGHDKPAKYPLMFRTADVLILNKIDLLPHTDFDLAEASRVARVLREGIEILEVSCRTGEGLDGWIAWLEHRLAHAKEHWDGMPHDHAPGQSHNHDHGPDHSHGPSHRHDPGPSHDASPGRAPNHRPTGGPASGA